MFLVKCLPPPVSGGTVNMQRDIVLVGLQQAGSMRPVPRPPSARGVGPPARHLQVPRLSLFDELYELSWLSV